MICALALFKAARDHHHDFSNADAAIQLSQAGYADEQILEMARSDQIDISQRGSHYAQTDRALQPHGPGYRPSPHRGFAHPLQRADRASEEHGHVGQSRFWTWSIKASPMIRRKN